MKRFQFFVLWKYFNYFFTSYKNVKIFKLSLEKQMEKFHIYLWKNVCQRPRSFCFENIPTIIQHFPLDKISILFGKKLGKVP